MTITAIMKKLMADTCDFEWCMLRANIEKVARLKSYAKITFRCEDKHALDLMSFSEKEYHPVVIWVPRSVIDELKAEKNREADPIDNTRAPV